MAKTKGPLMSLDARGNWGYGAIQFRGGLRGTHAYKPAPPGAVNQAQPTPAQETVRSAYQDILAEWQAMEEQEKMQWNEDANATTLPISGWNLFFKTRIGEILQAPTLPDPNTYTPPAADNILFPGTTWVTDTGYTPPAADNIIF